VSRLIDFLWRKDRATPAQVALVVILLIAPSVLLVPLPGAPPDVSGDSIKMRLFMGSFGGFSFWMPGQFSSAVVSWVALVSIAGAFAALFRYARGGATRPPSLRVAYWTLPVLVFIAIEIQVVVRVIGITPRDMNDHSAWFPIVLVTGAGLVVLAFLASRRGPTSGLLALVFGEKLARVVAIISARGIANLNPLSLLLDLVLLAVTAFVLARVETKQDDLPRAGLGWAAHPADALLLPESAAFLVDRLIYLRFIVTQSHFAGDPLAGTSVDLQTFFGVKQIIYFLAWMVAIPAMARWIAWTRAHAHSPEADVAA
jgi:hypothetical protein